MTTRLRVLASLLSVAFLGGCGGGNDTPKCIPGASVACACPSGQQGAQTCTSAGTFAACVCATPTVDAGGLGGAGGTTDSPPASGTGGQGTAMDAGGPGGADGNMPDAPLVSTGGQLSTGGASGLGGMAGTSSPGGTMGTGGLTSTGGITPGTGGNTSMGGTRGMGGATSTGGAVGTGGSSVVPPPSTCGNGLLDPNELCDCGTDSTKLPSGCNAVNGLFYGDGKGCSKTCTKEPFCLDNAGKTQACATACGDGNLDPGEDCDDGNLVDGDGCSSKCKIEDGFTCTAQLALDASTCQSGSGQCLELPVIYRDFQPENVASGGHPDFPFLGTKFGGSPKPTTLCVPNAGGLSKGNDSTARCVGIVAANLLNGKPQPGTTTKCDCQFSDWNVGNSSRIQGNYTQAANDSPLSDGAGAYQGGAAGTAVSSTSTAGAYTGTLTGYTSSTPGGPIWKGTVPAYKDANSFKQWFNDDLTVNKTFTGVLELPSIGANIYQYASKSHLAQGGFFPLDALNPSQATLCNLWPYYNHGDGTPFWKTCTGDQYLWIPRVMASDCVSGDSLDDGCWVTSVPGVRHDAYFTIETRYHFVYDGTVGISLSSYSGNDLYVFINGVLVLDLGGIHQQLPGKVTVSGSPGDARVFEGGCVDTAGNQIGASAGSTACSPGNINPKIPAVSPGDFSDHTVKLGLVTGKVYEIAIFGANRRPTDSDFQITLGGYTTRRSVCVPQ